MSCEARIVLLMAGNLINQYNFSCRLIRAEVFRYVIMFKGRKSSSFLRERSFPRKNYTNHVTALYFSFSAMFPPCTVLIGSLRAWRFGGSNPFGSEIFRACSFSRTICTGSFLGGNDLCAFFQHPSASSTEVANGLHLYLLFLSVDTMACHGVELYLYTFILSPN
jgi:hypothetical protein